MGQRAHYIIRSEGSFDLHYSHWGANRLDVDLLWGPEHAISFSEAQTRTDEWLNHVWCEGAALIDRDSKRLLWFGGEELLFNERERGVFHELLRASWPEWTVEWASNGLNDVVDALGVDRSVVAVDTEAREPFTEDWGCRVVEPSWVTTIVSIRHRGSQQVGLSDYLPTDVIERSVQLIDDDVVWRDSVRLEAVPHGGVHIDLDARSFSCWTAEPIPGPLIRQEDMSDDWTFERWSSGGLGKHLHLLEGLDVVWPSERSLMAQICERAMRVGAEADTVGGIESLAERLSEGGSKSVELSSWVYAHTDVPIDEEGRRAILRRALAELEMSDVDF